MLIGDLSLSLVKQIGSKTVIHLKKNTYNKTSILSITSYKAAITVQFCISYYTQQNTQAHCYCPHTLSFKLTLFMDTLNAMALTSYLHLTGRYVESEN